MDEAIVVRAMGGDHAAFEEVAASSLDRLHALAYSILGDASRADDATQVALLAIWRDLPRLRDASRFEAWSYRILVRACYAELRHKQRWLATIAGLVVRSHAQVRSRVPAHRGRGSRPDRTRVRSPVTRATGRRRPPLARGHAARPGGRDAGCPAGHRALATGPGHAFPARRTRR